MSAIRRLALLGTVTALALLTGVGAASAAGAAPATAESSPWSQSDGDAAHSRSNTSEHLLSQSTIAAVHPLRRIVAPSHPRGSVCSSNGATYPVLTGGPVYSIFDAAVAAYQAATGRRFWHGPRDPSKTTQYTSVSVSGSLVIAGSEYCESESDPTGYVTALNANTGQPVWSVPAEEGVFDTVVAGSTVLAWEFGNGNQYQVEAFDLSTGRHLWSAGLCDNTYRAVVVDGLAVFGSCTDPTPTIVGVALRTGKTAWRQSEGDVAVLAGDQSGPAARHLYVSLSYNHVTDLNPATGGIQGQLAGATGVLAVAGTRVFATCAAGLCAYLQSSHALSWSRAFSATLAAAANGVLYLSDGTALNAYTDQPLRSLFTGQASGLAVGDGRIAEVASGKDGPLKTLHLFGLAGY